jgi:hypothetical protein
VVELRDANGALVASTTTSSAGVYQFASLGGAFTMTSLTPYTVQLPANQAVLAGRYVTLRDQGADDSVDSDSVRNGATGVVSIAFQSPIDGRNNMTFDFGFRSIALGGDVWRDTDGDGSQDETTPVGSVLVTLYDSTGTTPLATTLSKTTARTCSAATLCRRWCPATTYTVGIVLPTDLQPTLPDNVPGNDATDSDGRLRPGSTTDVRSSVVTAPQIGTDTTTDFGWCRASRSATTSGSTCRATVARTPASARSRRHGALLEGSTEIARTTTDANGLYSFSSLLPGKALPQTTSGYSIEVSLAQAALATYVHHRGQAGGGGAARRQRRRVRRARNVSRAAVTTPVYGAVDNQYDFGFRDLRVGNRVWVDQNADGLQSAGEAGIGGRRRAAALVERHRAGGDRDRGRRHVHVHGGRRPRVGRAVRDPRRVQRRDARRPRALAADAGANDVVDSDARNSTDNAFAQVTLTAGAWGTSNFDVADFGFQPLLEIGDFVWRDTNGNGVQDAGEPGIANVAVTLTRTDPSSPLSAQTFTDANGFYLLLAPRLPGNAADDAVHAFVALGQVVLNGLQPTLDSSSVPGLPATDSDGVWNRVGATSQASAVLTPAFGGRILDVRLWLRAAAVARRRPLGGPQRRRPQRSRASRASPASLWRSTRPAAR